MSKLQYFNQPWISVIFNNISVTGNGHVVQHMLLVTTTLLELMRRYVIVMHRISIIDFIFPNIDTKLFQ